MNKIFTLKTVLTTLISTSIASSLMALPVRAYEDNLVSKGDRPELILSQNFSYNDRPRYPEPTEDFKKIVGITGLAVGIGMIGWYVTRAYKPSLVNSLPTINNQNASLLDRVSPRLRQQLLRLVHNRQTADRLLSGTLISNPDRSPNWLAEKVIYDLERDRA